MTIEVGSVLCDKYRLLAPIGRGGMGEVFAATYLDTGARVAIKVVTRSALGEILVQRLHREAMAAARVRSEYVPRLLDVARSDDGELFLVMELLEGETLSARLRRVGGFLAWEEVKWLGEHVLLGLIDAHGAGIVHRDLKPANIFMTAMPDGSERAKILDFGVCKLDTNDVENLTSTGEALGTVAYMAPEQIRGASRVDERADLYSFAMVMFEALSGRLAHDASGQVAMIASKLERSARPLRDLAQVHVPEGLDALITRALAKDPADRFASAQELLRAWRALGTATVAPRVLQIYSGVDASNMHTETVMTAGMLTRSGAPRGSRLGLTLAGATLVVASGLLVFLLFGRPRANATTSSGAMFTAAAAAHGEPASPTPRAKDIPVMVDPIEMRDTPAADSGATTRTAPPAPKSPLRPAPARAETKYPATPKRDRPPRLPAKSPEPHFQVDAKY